MFKCWGSQFSKKKEKQRWENLFSKEGENQRWPDSPSHVSPTEAAEIISLPKDKRGSQFSKKKEKEQRPASRSHVSPTEAAEMISVPKDKSGSQFSKKKEKEPRPASRSHVSPTEAAEMISLPKDKRGSQFSKKKEKEQRPASPPHVSPTEAAEMISLPKDKRGSQFSKKKEKEQRPASPSHVSPTEAAEMISLPKDKRGSQDQKAQPHPQNVRLVPFKGMVAIEPISSRLSTYSSNNYDQQRPASPSHVSPTEAAEIISVLKDKSVEELWKLLAEEEPYNNFLLSLDQVKTQNNVRDELQKETLQLARENLEKESQIMELRNQCRIIRRTELAAAQEKLSELERQKDEILRCYSSASLIQRLQEARNKTDEESEALHRQLLNREIELGAFVQKYKKLRTTYHRRALMLLAAKTSPIG